MSTWRIWAYALSLASIWLGLRFAFGHYFAYNYAEAQPKGVLLNLVFLLSLILITLYTTYSKEPQVRSYFDDFKLSLRAGVAYSVAIGLAIGVYYSTANDMTIKRAADYAHKLAKGNDRPPSRRAVPSKGWNGGRAPWPMRRGAGRRRRRRRHGARARFRRRVAPPRASSFGPAFCLCFHVFVL